MRLAIPHMGVAGALLIALDKDFVAGRFVLCRMSDMFRFAMGWQNLGNRGEEFMRTRDDA